MLKFQTKLYSGTGGAKSGFYVISATKFAKYAEGPPGLRSFYICRTKSDAMKLFKALKADKENEWAEVWIDRYAKGTKRIDITSQRAHFFDPENLLAY